MATGAAGQPRISIRLPTAKAPEETSAPSFVLGRPVAGLRVGLRTDQAWRSWALIAADWERRLRGCGAEPVMLETSAYIGSEGARDRQNVKEWADSIDCGIVGLGTCGSCTSYSVADAVTVEERGKPVVVVLTSEFEAHGRNMAGFLGHGDLKVLVLPYPLEGRPAEDLERIATEYFPEAMSMLGATSE